MNLTSRAPKITMHRERIPVAPGARRFIVRHYVHIGGERFATITSIGAMTSSWRVWIDDPKVQTGDFYGLADARAWALEMAARKLDPARGPIVSTLGRYGNELRVTPLPGEDEDAEEGTPE